jgi:hypothetical protein
MKKRSPESATAALADLRTALEKAVDLARELADDDLLARVIAAFRAMPMQDRPVIVGVLEREVTGRLLSRATEKPLGQSTHPNPNARLYVRAHDSGFDHRLYDRDEMMIADIRAMRIACLIRNVPEIYAIWKDALREAMGHVEEPVRRVAEELLTDGIEAIAEARKAETAAATETADHADAGKRTRRS